LVPLIPLASLADFALEQGALSPAPELAAREKELLERIHAPVSPLAAPSLLDPRRVLVVGARADRITPVSHARRVATHFGAPLHTWHGGHLLQFGRSEAFGKVAQLLATLEIIEPRP
jgi:predicted alpha/beta hydrolase family esterase